MARGRVLVVDDEATSRTVLGERLRSAGYVVELAADGFKALGKLDDFRPDIVLTDLRMPGMDGLDFLRRLRARGDMAVVLMTSFGAIETAVKAMKEGAADYLTKPLNLTQLLLVVARELERLQLRREAQQLRTRLHDRYTFRNVIGTSEAMQAACKAAAQAAQSRANILITGEPGTGKALLATTIHECGPRSDRPLVTLMGSAGEVFATELAAKMAEAEGGELYLPNVGALGTAAQLQLLRALDEATNDVRLITSAQRDLRNDVSAGSFREDLYYRLCVVAITLPPLRQRHGDIPLLAAHFLDQSAHAHGKKLEGLSDAALARLATHAWPGNVRELASAIERAVVFATGTQIEAGDLPAMESGATSSSIPIRVPGSSLEQLEKWAILTTLEACGGATGKAAKILGISARKIQYKLQQYENAPKGETPVLSESPRDDGDEAAPEDQRE
jgi:DNA-binding NtrC family response regulator